MDIAATPAFEDPEPPPSPRLVRPREPVGFRLEGSAFHLTDLGNARRLAARYGLDLHFLVPNRRWLVWDRSRWSQDRDLRVERLAKEIVEALHREAELAPDEQTRAALRHHALRSESMPRLRAMVDLAASEPGIAVLPEDLDADQMLFAVCNGTLDLATGTLRPSSREDLITRVADVEFDPRATCPQWTAFLHQVTDGDHEFGAYLGRLAGYAMTGLTSEQALFLLYGDGANGKTTFLSTLKAALGEYAVQAPFTTFSRSASGPRNDLARLAGSRLVVATEGDDGMRLAEGTAKLITGGDPVTARFLFSEFFEHVPTYKVMLATNHLPDVQGTDHALWRRLQVVPFAVRILPDRMDPHLTSALAGELPGILAWMVRGCLEWQERGLDPPLAIRQATAEYRKSEDVIGRFLEESCAVGRGLSVRGIDLYAAYTRWCGANGEQARSHKHLGGALARRGFRRERRGSPTKVWTWLGLDLLSSRGPVGPVGSVLNDDGSEES